MIVVKYWLALSHARVHDFTDIVESQFLIGSRNRELKIPYVGDSIAVTQIREKKLLIRVIGFGNFRNSILSHNKTCLKVRSSDNPFTPFYTLSLLDLSDFVGLVFYEFR